MDRIKSLLANSAKPLIWAGNGIRLAGEAKRFRTWIDHTGLPVVTTWTAADLLPTDHPCNLGIVGISGQRGANRAVQECDFLLALGSHLSLPQTSTLVNQFAPLAKIAVVDCDAQQLEHLTVNVAVKLHASLVSFFDLAHNLSFNVGGPLDHYKAANIPPDVGSYLANKRMTALLPPGSNIIIDGGGTALYTGFQSSIIKEGTRLICSSSTSAMGSGIPEAVGACLASGGRLTSLIIGDGSMMCNMQELATVKHHNLPIKIFIVCNGGYLAIRHTQDAFQESRYTGVDSKDLSFPNFGWIAEAFGIPFFDGTDEETIGIALDCPGPAVCLWNTPQDQPMIRQAYIDGKPQNLGEMQT